MHLSDLQVLSEQFLITALLVACQSKTVKINLSKGRTISKELTTE